MYIHEAIQKAMETGRCIHNIKSAFPDVIIHPTNTPECCIVCVAKKESPRWNPKAKDLTSDGWELYEG